MFAKRSSVAFAVHSVQCAIECYIQIVARSFVWKSRWSSLRGKRNRQIEFCQQTQITHRVTTDLVRSAIRSAEIAGNVVGVSGAVTVKAVLGLERSTVRGMSNVNQRKDDNDERAHQRRLGDDA